MGIAVVTNDIVNWLPPHGAAIVTPIPVPISGTGSGLTYMGMAVCVEGDEKNVMSSGCMYISGSYSIPGTGMLKISALAGDQLAKKTKVGGKKVILVGSQFTSEFQVMAPAMMPTPGGPVPDPVPKYSGKGMFISTGNVAQRTTS